MKKKITAAVVLLAAVLVFFAAFFSPLKSNGITARADSYSPYSFYFSAYGVDYIVNTDCSINVTETITINYTGSRSTGFMCDIPIDGGVSVRNLTVSEYSGGGEISVDYDVYFYSYNGYDYITADIGDATNKTGEEHTYIIRYDYYIPKQDNLLAMNPISTNHENVIYNASVTIEVPDGFISESTKCYTGGYASDSESEFSYSEGVITVSYEYLGGYEGVSFDLYFESGILTSSFNALPWLLLLIGAAIIAALVILKFLVFTNPPLAPVVNFDAPDNMDPLAMGQLIDGKISNEDVTSLIYYWADKGYLKINMADENDPMLIRVYKSLPDDAPEYQIEMYDAIFARGDSVKVSSLSEKFYPTIERVRTKASIKRGSMYTTASRAAALIFAILGGLFAGILPILLSVIQISSKLASVEYLIAVIPAVVVFLLALSVYYFRYKRKTYKTVLLLIAIALFGGVMVAIYAWLIPYAAFATAPKIIAGIISIAIGMLSVTLVTRTELYNEQLNGILGFRNFILYAEKDRLEAMLEEDPQLYYHVLPYAQVLGVTDKWEDKFKALTVEPPKWMVDPYGSYIGFVAVNRCIRVSFLSMNKHMVSRPPSNGGGGFGGRGGGFSGGFGGGVGGGFGGSGFRGR